MKTNYALSFQKITNLFNVRSKSSAQILKVTYDNLLSSIPNDYFKSADWRIKEHIESETFQSLLKDIGQIKTPTSRVTQKWEDILSEYYGASLEAINKGLDNKNYVETIYNIESEFSYFSPNFNDSLQEVFVVLSAQFVILSLIHI